MKKTNFRKQLQALSAAARKGFPTRAKLPELMADIANQLVARATEGYQFATLAVPLPAGSAQFGAYERWVLRQVTEYVDEWEMATKVTYVPPAQPGAKPMLVVEARWSTA